MYDAMDFSSLLGIDGFSETLLKDHFTLYSGYVSRSNTLIQKLKSTEAGTPEYQEMRRRFGWEFNGMRLHELYFGNMGKENHKLGDDSPLYKKMVECFGSGDNCHADFTKAMVPGIGWIVMYYDKKADWLFNVWIDDHATNHLSGCVPLVVMDMWEHAFMTDYGLKKADYMEAFVKNIDWAVVEKRYEEARKG